MEQSPVMAVPLLKIGRTFFPLTNILNARLEGSNWVIHLNSTVEPRVIVPIDGPDAWMVGHVLEWYWNQTRWAAGAYTKAEREKMERPAKKVVAKDAAKTAEPDTEKK